MRGHFQTLASNRVSLQRELPGNNTEHLIALEERALGNVRWLRLTIGSIAT